MAMLRQVIQAGRRKNDVEVRVRIGAQDLIPVYIESESDIAPSADKTSFSKKGRKKTKQLIEEFNQAVRSVDEAEDEAGIFVALPESQYLGDETNYR